MSRLTIPTAASLRLVPPSDVDASLPEGGDVAKALGDVAKALIVLEEKLERLRLARLSYDPTTTFACPERDVNETR